MITKNTYFVQNFVDRLDFFYSYRWLLFPLLFAFFLTPEVHAQSRQSLEEQRKKILVEIEETNRFLRATEQNRSESNKKLNLLNAQITQFDRLISSIRAEIAYVDRQINETSATVSRMNNEVEKMKTEYARLVAQAYKNRGQYNKLIYVLSARDFNEAYRRMKYFQQYSEYRKKQVAEIKAKQDELQVVITQLATQKTDKEKLLAVQRQESQKLEATKAERSREVNNLRSQERRLRNQLEEQRRNAQRLQSEIEKSIAAEARKRNTTTANIHDKLTPDELLISNNFRGNKGRLPWPTERGTISGFFGIYIPNPLFRNITLNNNGVDITTVGEASVRVVFDGEVSTIGGILGYNMFVTVRHGNYITVYANLANVAVKQGDKVKSRQNIGKVYTERGANTAVLHFEIWEGLNKLNPEQWIAKN